MGGSLSSYGSATSQPGSEAMSGGLMAMGGKPVEIFGAELTGLGLWLRLSMVSDKWWQLSFHTKLNTIRKM